MLLVDGAPSTVRCRVARGTFPAPVATEPAGRSHRNLWDEAEVVAWRDEHAPDGLARRAAAPKRQRASKPATEREREAEAGRELMSEARRRRQAAAESERAHLAALKAECEHYRDEAEALRGDRVETELRRRRDDRRHGTLSSLKPSPGAAERPAAEWPAAEWRDLIERALAGDPEIRTRLNRLRARFVDHLDTMPRPVRHLIP